MLVCCVRPAPAALTRPSALAPEAFGGEYSAHACRVWHDVAGSKRALAELSEPRALNVVSDASAAVLCCLTLLRLAACPLSRRCGGC